MIPILSGLSCAKAAANIPGAAIARTLEPASLEKLRRVSFIGASRDTCASVARLLAYHKYISDIAASGFFGQCQSENDCPANRSVIYQTQQPRERRRRRDGIIIEYNDGAAPEYRATYRHRIAGWYNGWLH